MVAVCASDHNTTRWEQLTSLADGGGKNDGFVATGVMEIVYEEDSFTLDETESLPPLQK